MVTRRKNDKDRKNKGKVKVNELKLNKETVKELTDSELAKVQGGMAAIVGRVELGAVARDGDCSTVPTPTPDTGTGCALYLCQNTWTCNLECI